MLIYFCTRNVALATFYLGGIMEYLSKYISRTARCAILYRNAALEPYGLNGHHHAYILTIMDKPGISQEALARAIFVNKSSVTRQITILEARGFVERRPSKEDRRQLEIYPTEKCRTLFPKIEEVLHAWNNHLLNDFSREEQLLLVQMMQKVAARSAKFVETELNQSSED
jgi:DNA-binding MarR family transcriptional regulator